MIVLCRLGDLRSELDNETRGCLITGSLRCGFSLPFVASKRLETLGNLGNGELFVDF